MSELLETYDLEGKYLGDQARDEFYQLVRKEFQDTGRITRQVKTIRLLMLNSAGRVYLQKRSSTKAENAGLYDKTVGGHVLAGHTWELTVVKECAEELGFPAVVLDDTSFEQAKTAVDLSTIGVFQLVEEVSGYESHRIRKDGNYTLPQITRFYVGYFNGKIMFVDGESSGIEVYDLDSLRQDIQEHPNRYTHDLRDMIDRLGGRLQQ